ncbi:MAG: DUF2795 domain-containing protein [Chloroflexi bacterium]|nr:DUF2795 domain-containing protein [Chloroflexota bacterium]
MTSDVCYTLRRTQTTRVCEERSTVPLIEPTDPTLWAARVADYVSGVRFPASRAELVARAVQGNVPRDVLSALLALPHERYAAFDELLAELRPAEHYRTALDRQPLRQD